MSGLIRKAVAYLDPLNNESLSLKKEFEAWDRPSRMLQIRFIAFLTALLYILFSYLEHEVLSIDILSFAKSLHLFFLPPLLLLISAMTFNQRLYKPMIVIYAIAPVLANMGNLYLTELLRTSPIYVSEAYTSEVYLIIIWILAISGLRFSYAFISASICAVLTLGYQIYFLVPQDIFYLHQLWMFSAFSFGVVSALVIDKNNKRIFLDARQLEQLATTDKLSGLHNRKTTESYCKMEIERAKLYNETFSLILMDIDHFKEINSAYGQKTGDQVIENLSKILRKCVRNIDCVGRWGGESFLILLPKMTAKQAFIIAENIRIRIMENDFSPDLSVTISGGIAEYLRGDTIERIVQRADEALYQAKESGRNQIRMN